MHGTSVRDRDGDCGVTIRYATMADVQAFHKMQEADPSHNHVHILENSIKAWVVEKDGKLACIAGVVYGKSYIEAFSDVAPDLDAPKIMIWRYAKILADKIKDLNIGAMAICRENPDSSRFLESMGFHYAGMSNNKKIYRI